MAGVLDFLFGGDALKKAAGPTTPSPGTSTPAGIDIGKMAQDAADKAKASKPTSSTASPISSPMTPQAPNGKKNN